MQKLWSLGCSFKMSLVFNSMWFVKTEEGAQSEYTGRHQEKALEHRTETDQGGVGGSDHPLSSNQAQMFQAAAAATPRIKRLRQGNYTSFCSTLFLPCSTLSQISSQIRANMWYSQEPEVLWMKGYKSTGNTQYWKGLRIQIPGHVVELVGST